MANGSDYEKYTYRVIWSKEDNEFVGLCDEFRSLSYLSEIESEALDGIKNLTFSAEVPHLTLRSVG